MEARESNLEEIRRIEIPVHKDFVPGEIPFTLSEEKDTGVPRIVGPFYGFVKRASDLVIAILVIFTINIWLLPLLAVLIKLTSPGPVFFVQWRTGKQNKRFRCIKLRSMYINGDADHRQASRNDPRITPAGRLLRKFSLDELPQFFNVLMGQMSVVGPRPHMITHTSAYEGLVKDYSRRLLVRPGITGLSQVEGYRGEIKEKRGIVNRVRLDVFYINNWSLLLDMHILWKTVKLILVGDKQAY